MGTDEESYCAQKFVKFRFRCGGTQKSKSHFVGSEKPYVPSTGKYDCHATKINIYPNCSHLIKRVVAHLSQWYLEREQVLRK